MNLDLKNTNKLDAQVGSFKEREREREDIRDPRSGRRVPKNRIFHVFKKVNFFFQRFTTILPQMEKGKMVNLRRCWGLFIQKNIRWSSHLYGNDVSILVMFKIRTSTTHLIHYPFHFRRLTDPSLIFSLL